MAAEKIQVVGAGQMGSGVAQVAAQAGLSVHLSDVDAEAIEKGLKTITKHLARSVEKERISQDEMDEALGRIELGTGIPFPKHKNHIAPGGGVPSGVKRKRRRDDIVGDNQTLAREVMGMGRRRTGGSRCRYAH